MHQPTTAVRGLVNEISLGSAATATVTINDSIAEVSNRSFLLPELTLSPGENVIVATAVDASGNVGEAEARVIFEPPAGPAISLEPGNLQTGTIGSELPEPLVVRLSDALGEPVAGKPVFFKVTGNNGSLGDGRRQVVVTTDEHGLAAVTFVLGTRAGAGSQRVEASAPGFAGKATFIASASPGPPANLHVDSGDQQVGAAGQPLPDSFVAVVTDSGFNRLGGVPVTFQVVKGQGVFAGGGQAEVVATSDSRGRASALLRLDPAEGIANNVVEAWLAEYPEVRFATFVASGRAVGDADQTSVSGLVLDNSDLPVPGATVWIAGTELGTSTDADGLFHIPEAPAGSFLLEVDGSTTSRPGVWPHLEFEMTTVPGRDNSLGRPIYLLPIDVDRGLPVSETEGGTLTLPELPGFSLDIEPGSVTLPDGGHSGIVSVTLVHSEKVPMVPNVGLQPRFVVTIQPGGATFDPPAPLTFPNVDALAPGEVIDLYSFDHDLGSFVSIGPGTVSEDGLKVVSNPGVGVAEAGWWSATLPSATGTPNDCPQCTVPSASTCVPRSGQCSLGDPCKADGHCENGRCVGDDRKILSVDSTANGNDLAIVDMLEPVTYRAEVEHEHCEELTASWDFDAPEIPDKAKTDFGPITLSYDTPGLHRYTVDVDCQGCDQGSDRGVVFVRCPEVKITGTDPDTGVLCGDGCSMTFFAEIKPVDLTVDWEITNGFDLVTTSTPTTGPIFGITAIPESDKGTATVRAFNKEAEIACPSASDQRSVFVFAPPSSPKIGGLTPGEIGVGIELAAAAALGDAKAMICLRSLQTIRADAIALGKEIWNLDAPGCEHGDSDPPNSLLHAIANCMTASICGTNISKQFWDAHENFDTNACPAAQLDFHNNELGRSFAVPLRPEVCGVLMQAALLDGQLLWAKDPASEDPCQVDADLESLIAPDHHCLLSPQGN